MNRRKRRQKLPRGKPLAKYTDQELAYERDGLRIVPGDPAAWENFARHDKLQAELKRRFQARLDAGPLNKLEIEYWGMLLGNITGHAALLDDHFRMWVSEEGRRRAERKQTR